MHSYRHPNESNLINQKSRELLLLLCSDSQSGSEIEQLSQSDPQQHFGSVDDSFSSDGTAISNSSELDDAVSRIPHSSCEVHLSLDIADLILDAKTEDLICRLRSMPKVEKYALLKEHYRPADTFSFPKTFVGGCNRSFKQEWLNTSGYATVQN